MKSHDSHRPRRHARRIEELRLWRNAYECPVKGWQFTVREGEPRGIELGDFWPEIETPVWLSAETKIPAEWAGLPVKLWLGGEGFVELSNGVSGGLNPFHLSFPVAEKARGGAPLRIVAEVVSKGLWGSQVAEPRLERDLALICEACKELGGHEAVPHLIDALDAAFGSLAAVWPSETETARARYLHGYADPMGIGLSSLPPVIAERLRGPERLRSLWNVPPAPRNARATPWPRWISTTLRQRPASTQPKYSYTVSLRSLGARPIQNRRPRLSSKVVSRLLRLRSRPWAPSAPGSVAADIRGRFDRTIAHLT